MANFIYINVNVPGVVLTFDFPGLADPQTFTPITSGDHYRYDFAFSSGNSGGTATFSVPRRVGGYELDGWYAAQYWGVTNNWPVADYSIKFSAGETVTGNQIVANTPYQNDQGGGSPSVARDCCIKYRGISVGVMFDAGGGDLADFYREVRYQEQYGSLPTPTWPGHTFTGWYTAASGGTQVTSSTTVTTDADHTLYAHWTTDPETVTITFNPNGGTCATASKTVTTQSAYGTLPTPTRSGYTFNGWFTASGGGSRITADTVVVIGYDHQLYAQWAGEPLTITFDATGGTVTPASKVVARGDYYGWLPVPTRTGYAFAGWYTAADGGSMISGMPTGDTTIYAHWAEPLPDGGSAAMISQYTSP